jgi:hypothetical protein
VSIPSQRLTGRREVRRPAAKESAPLALGKVPPSRIEAARSESSVCYGTEIAIKMDFAGVASVDIEAAMGSDWARRSQGYELSDRFHKCQSLEATTTARERDHGPITPWAPHHRRDSEREVIRAGPELETTYA